MTLVASLLFAIALGASVGAIMLTIGNAMPRIIDIIEAEFAPVIKVERKIIFGEIKSLKPAAAEVIIFPVRAMSVAPAYKLAA